MFLAPDVELTATRLPHAQGLRGVLQTLAVMRALVIEYRCHPAIRKSATSIIFLTPERDELGEVSVIFNWVRDSIRYTRDIAGMETLSTPDKTLAGRIGDCDDQATLLAALFEAAGYPTRFVVAGYSGDMPEHVYVQVYAADDDGLSSWISADATEREPIGYAPPDPTVIYTEQVPCG